jgi:predicted transcriptional regulator
MVFGCYFGVTRMEDVGAMSTNTTSVKLPPKLKARITALARKSGRSAHSFIVEAVERHAEREERVQAFVREALAADADIERTGKMYRAEDVHAWLGRLAKGRKTARPKPWRR